MTYKGDKYICTVVFKLNQNSWPVRQQGFQGINQESHGTGESEIGNFAKQTSIKLFQDQDAHYNGGDEDERKEIEDKAYEKLGAFMVIVTAEQDLYKTCKDSL